MRIASRNALPKSSMAPRGEAPPTAGWIVDASNTQILVDYAGNARGPLVARTVLAPAEQPPPETPVLLLFENGDESLPIVVGILREQFGVPASSPSAPALRTRQQIVVDVESLLVNASQEIVFRCGEGSVTIQRDGSVVVRGTKVLSRSSGMNRMQGGAVRIN